MNRFRIITSFVMACGPLTALRSDEIPAVSTTAEVLSSSAAATSPAVRGVLGADMGTLITIEGKKRKGLKTTNNSLTVTTVDGKKRRAPVMIWVENVKFLPAGTTVILKGKEKGRWAGGKGRIPRRYIHYFDVEEVTSPSSVEIKPSNIAP